jgi:hypothetical protein
LTPPLFPLAPLDSHGFPPIRHLSEVFDSRRLHRIPPGFSAET